ncbi:ABC transporter ATP-binding protein [uncultured Subdoligranulum sp.]|uniref:ABC transporter ATP-binding protein n=1 Tax=uncultured Subdoligranulum sp. TaxID=512298 RepID=UPI0026137F6E|nr:ABC transporter ATP-binding protein [uncultured Subdoligranulum sp.]
MISEVLEIKNLSVSIDSPGGTVQAVRDVSLTLHKGEVLAIVGESGCGKSILCRSVMKLLPRHARIVQGSIVADGADITQYSERDMVKLRGKLFSMIFQDPMTALDPTMTIGAQIAEAVLAHHKKLPKEEVYRRVIELMELVGIRQPRERYRLYPYNFSGGMRQRSILAMALAGSPKILLADEPTTALDVTIQAQILNLLRDIQTKLGTATILVSHDLSVVARAADRVAIMYAGKIVETGTAEEIYYDPRHPYTWGLLQALPSLSRGRRELRAIPGMPPSLVDPPPGDAFACRNEYALAIDYEQAPPMFRISDTHYAATWLLDPRAPKIRRPAGGERNV